MSENIYSQERIVSESFVEANGTLKLAKLLALIQEVSLGGSNFLHVGVETLHEKNLYWVVMSYRFEIAKMPRVDDKITLFTYPGEARSFVYPRHYYILDDKNNVIVRGVSLWAILDRNTHRPTLGSQTGFIAPAVKTEGELGWPLPMDLGDLTEKEVRLVRNSDLDFNNHMNNIRYLDFALDTEPTDFFVNHEVATLQITFSKETMPGAQMHLLTSQKEKTHSYQGVVDGKSVFSAQITLK
jgi:medium-chain acyl-[acyl-carrier-protein] hydrolase